MNFIRSIAWLHDTLNEQPSALTIFDCRYDLMDEDAGELAYRNGHIPGAYYASLSFHLSSAAVPTGEGGRHPLPNPQQFAQYLSERGVLPSSLVVAYDDQGGAMASRLRWLLKWVGHTGEIYIIEEGFKGWQAAGYEVETVIPPMRYGAEYQVDLQSNMLVDRHYVHNQLHNKAVAIIDSRDGARYRGEHEPIDKKAGHIPTARHFV